jgi:hypothetical protein
LGAVGGFLGNVIGGAGNFVGGIARGFGDGVGKLLGSGGSTIWDLLVAIVELPAKLAEAIGIRALFDGIGSLISSIPEILRDVLNFLNRLISNLLNLFMELFVPSEGFFERSFGGFNDRFEAKIPILGQGKGLLEDFTDIVENAGETPPEIRIQGEIFGAEIDENIINLTWFAPYRLQVHSMIITIAYVAFIRRVIRKIPSLIGGI